MKSNFILIFFCTLLGTFASKAQLSGFSDNFSDGNFSANPKWIGDSSKFEVLSQQLRLNDASGTSPAYLSTYSPAISNAIWEFKLELQFAPSASNYARVYLVSDKANPQLATKGYFVQIGGESGNVDDISLFKFSGSSEEKIIDGWDGMAADNPHLYIKVLRDSSGYWELYSDSSQLFNNLQNEGSSMDTTHQSSSYFSIQCIYTSTRSNLFYFDDIKVVGEKAIDTLPPELIKINVLSDSSIHLVFSENISESGSLDTANYSTDNDLGRPKSVSYKAEDSTGLILSFHKKFIDLRSYELLMYNIMDKNSNHLKNSKAYFIYYSPKEAEHRELVINEIFADPSPSVGMPEEEFIEIYNASNNAFDLKNWILKVNSTNTLLESHLILPDSFVLLSPSMLYKKHGPLLHDNYANLSNSGADVQLISPEKKLIDHISYKDSWYADESKIQGGYSLEQINPYRPCSGKSNFMASTNIYGATPGIQNSVFDPSDDQSPPIIEKAFMISNDSAKLFFNEVLDSTIIDLKNFKFSNSINITSIQSNESWEELILKISPPLDTAKIKELKVHSLKDCSGNSIVDTLKIQLVLPELARKNDVVINEVLFNPRSAGYDFVEFYNRSDKIVSLRNWSIANADISYKSKISSEPIILFPGAYRVVCENPENILWEYPRSIEDNLIKVQKLPSFNNDEGEVSLLNEKSDVIDHLVYSEKMHFALLDNVKGISLERINPHIASSEVANYTSAAASEGYATPGYQNSQFFQSSNFHGSLNIEPKVFSPDNDGHEDILHINYQFSSNDNVASVNIYDKKGRKIKTLCNNELLGKKGSLQWDGISDEGEKAKLGIYVIHFESFNLLGEKQEIKESCVLASFLD